VRALLLALALLSPIERLDWEVAREVQAARCPALEGVMREASALGRPAVVAGGLAAVLLLDLAGGGGWSTVRLALAALAGTNLVVETLKWAIGRQRPDGEHKRSNSSFPSSHAANAFALAWVLGARWRRALPLFVALALLVAFSRMYLNRHFLSDVVAAALIGMACAWAAARWLPLRRRAAEAGTVTPSP
jgi:membrane-associated phospholipid phosphatase